MHPILCALSATATSARAEVAPNKSNKVSDQLLQARRGARDAGRVSRFASLHTAWTNRDLAGTHSAMVGCECDDASAMQSERERGWNMAHQECGDICIGVALWRVWRELEWRCCGCFRSPAVNTQAVSMPWPYSLHWSLSYHHPEQLELRVRKTSFPIRAPRIAPHIVPVVVQWLAVLKLANQDEVPNRRSGVRQRRATQLGHFS